MSAKQASRGSSSFLPALLLVLAMLAGCASPPGAEELPEDGDPGRQVVLAEEQEEPPPAPEEPDEAPPLPVKRLMLKDVRGGETVFELTGSPEQVAAALLDFDEASGHRAWAPEIAGLPPKGKTLCSRWTFEGKVGVNPVIVLGFQRRESEGEIQIRFRILEEDFGLAAFFGDYKLRPLPGEEARTQVTARIFIDSGILLANASHDEIAAGLREDARMLEDWMRERLGLSPRRS